MKSISPVIATVILLLMTVAAGGLAYITITGFQSQAESGGKGAVQQMVIQTQSQLKIESVSGGKIYVRNIGTQPISKIVTYLDGIPRNITCPDTLEPGQVYVCNVGEEIPPCPTGYVQVQLGSGSTSSTIRVRCEQLQLEGAPCDADANCTSSQWCSEGRCSSCSNLCDNSCQSANCNPEDPDCDTGGNPTLVCCGNGDCESGESSLNCPQDCGATECTPANICYPAGGPYVGWCNSTSALNETKYSPPVDGSYCSNCSPCGDDIVNCGEVCEFNENCTSPANDYCQESNQRWYDYNLNRLFDSASRFCSSCSCVAPTGAWNTSTENGGVYCTNCTHCGDTLVNCGEVCEFNANCTTPSPSCNTGNQNYTYYSPSTCNSNCLGCTNYPLYSTCQTTGSCPTGTEPYCTNCTHCGDTVCNCAENCTSCPGDCPCTYQCCNGACCSAGTYCSGGSCVACTNTCNGICQGPGCTSDPDCTSTPCCGNLVCSTGENCGNCPSDCGVCHLNLENSTEWNDPYSSSTHATSIYAVNLDADTPLEIVTGGYTLHGSHEDGQLRIWNQTGGRINLENSTTWDAPGLLNTVVWSVYAADINIDTTPEIITGGYNEFMGVYAQLRIWNITGGKLILANSTEWQDMGDTYVQSVYATNIDADSALEIITLGRKFSSPNYYPQLKIWNYTNGKLLLENLTEWNDPFTANEWPESVFAANIDADAAVEIITLISKTSNKAQLRIWNYTNRNLLLENSTEWNSPWSTYNPPRSVYAADVDADAAVELITTEVVDDGSNAYSQIRIWNYTNGKLLLENATNFTDYLSPVYALDLDNDTSVEIITGGSKLTIWNYTSGNLYIENSASDSSESVYATNIDTDNDIEILTTGYAGAKGQLKIWNYTAG